MLTNLRTQDATISFDRSFPDKVCEVILAWSIASLKTRLTLKRRVGWPMMLPQPDLTLPVPGSEEMRKLHW